MKVRLITTIPVLSWVKYILSEDRLIPSLYNLYTITSVYIKEDGSVYYSLLECDYSDLGVNGYFNSLYFESVSGKLENNSEYNGIECFKYTMYFENINALLSYK